MKELLTELRNKVLYLRNTDELSAKGELILLHRLNAIEKEFAICGVSKSFALGKTVKVNRCIYGHEFNLGETVDIIDYEPNQTTRWLCSNGRNQWWLSEDEANVC